MKIIGKENLNIAVGEHIMGWDILINRNMFSDWNPSTDLCQAMQVLDNFDSWEIDHKWPHGNKFRVCLEPILGNICGGIHDTLEVAICLAALRTLDNVEFEES